MATLRNYYNTTGTTGISIYEANYSGQTFTTSESYSIESVRLWMGRSLTPGTLTVDIFATSSGLPTGSALTSGTYDGNSIGEDFEWVSISLSPYVLSSGVKYAIVIHCPELILTWGTGVASPSLTGGRVKSSDSGSSWTTNAYFEMVYEVYGNNIAPTVTTQSVTTIASTTATGRGNVTSDGGATVTERGVCWSTSSTPTTAGSKATASGTTGAFTASITGLSPSTLYYVRAYAINSVGTSYGSQVTFTTSAQNITFGEYLGAGSSTTKLLLHLNGNNSDSSGNSISGSDSNATYSLANGKFGQGVGYTGVNVSGTIYSGLPAINTTYTIGFWFNPTVSTSGSLISSRTGTVEYTTEIQVGTNKFSLVTGDGTSFFSIADVSYTISNGTWYNVFVVYTTTGLSIYVNGSFVASRAYTGTPRLTPASGQICVGYSSRYTTQGFNGKIDEVILESRAWTASEIKKYYTNSLGRF